MLFDILMGVGYKGGVENVVNRTARFLKDSGHSVRIVQLIDLGYRWVLPNLEIYSLASSEESQLDDIEFFALKYKDLNESHGLPHVIFATGWPITVSVAKIATDAKVKVISWMHGSVEACNEIGLGGYDELKEADAHLAINAVLADKLRQTTKKEVLEVINPIDVSRIVYSNIRETYKLAYVGRIANEKNIPFIIDALRKSSPLWTLDVVGDSDEAGTGVKVLEEYCCDIGVDDRVFFHGWMDNPWEILKDNCALVLASVREGSPLVAVEAMLCGMPVISTPTDGVIDKIVPGENGYLFPFNDTSAFLKILSMIENGMLPRIPAEHVRNSMKRFRGDYPLEDMLEKVMKFVEQ